MKCIDTQITEFIENKESKARTEKKEFCVEEKI
jgi:hypothetical protein